MWVLKAGDLFDGRYRIQREIGAGGMAYVYAALDEELQDAVALKIIRPELVGDEELIERFKREVRIARQIHHPNIVRIFEFGRTTQEEKTFYYLTMELLPGVDLSTWLLTRGSISLNEILEIALQLCDALDEAHRSGVIHRDIKPQNIFIDENGRATLMDFGISRLATLTGLTSSSQLMGTPRYMSPEQVSGDQELDHRSDLYSLGIVLYELCTHEVPFSGQTPVEIALRHIQDVPKPPRTINAQLPATMEEVILTCLIKEPNSRYQSADDLRSALLTVAQESGVETLLSSPSGIGARRTVGNVGGTSSITKAPAAAPTGRSLDADRAEPTPTTTTQTKSLSSNRSLLLLVGALALIGAVAVAASLLLLRSPSEQTADAPGRVETEGDVTSTDQGETEAALELSERIPEGSGSETNATADENPGVTGGVRISANPGTEIYIDGKLAGTIPPVIKRQLSSGSHRIRYVIPGYDEFEETVDVSGGRENLFAHHFTPYGALRIVCQPIATVSLDGRVVGETPFAMKRIREGAHHLVLSREGYRTLEQTIDIRLGQINPFQFTLARR